jgi:hypothetical protein
MASDVKLSVLAKNAILDALTAQLGAGALIDLYDGTKPASPDTAVSTQNKLVTLTGATPFAPAASGGVLTAGAIANGSGSVAAGSGKTATWARISTSGGTAKIDVTVAAAGADLNINNPNIATGQTVSVSSFTITAPN